MLASAYYKSTIVKTMISQEKLGGLSKEIIAYGLLGICFFAAGCGGPSKESIEKREETKRQATEKKLKAMLYPAMAQVGRRAVTFARENPDEFTWYKDYDDQWNFSISDEEGRHKADLYLQKGVDRSNITLGDVDFVHIINEEATTNIFGRRYNLSSEVRVETDNTVNTPCGKGLQASANFIYTSSDEQDESSSFVIAGRCGDEILNFELGNNPDAAKTIVAQMNTELSEAFSQIK